MQFALSNVYFLFLFIPIPLNKTKKYERRKTLNIKHSKMTLVIPSNCFFPLYPHPYALSCLHSLYLYEGEAERNEDDRPLYGQHFIHHHIRNIYYYTVHTPWRHVHVYRISQKVKILPEIRWSLTKKTCMYHCTKWKTRKEGRKT